jgi:hypothetical protein
MKHALVVGVVAVGCYGGCGGGGGGGGDTLTCAYLAGDSCWKTTAAKATSCLPAAGTTGVLSADNASCTYATGQVVTFTPALTLPLPQGSSDWNFTVTTNGAPCLRYTESASGFELTAGGALVSEATGGGGGLELTCPDGTTYANANPLSLLSCPGASLGDLPGNTSSSTATSINFGLLNASATSTDVINVFACSR